MDKQEHMCDGENPTVHQLFRMVVVFCEVNSHPLFFKEGERERKEIKTHRVWKEGWEDFDVCRKIKNLYRYQIYQHPIYPEGGSLIKKEVNTRGGEFFFFVLDKWTYNCRLKNFIEMNTKSDERGMIFRNKTVQKWRGGAVMDVANEEG